MARRLKEHHEMENKNELNRLKLQKARLKEFLLENEVGKKIKENKKQELMKLEAKYLREAEEGAIARENQRAREESERQRKMKERVKVVEHSDVMQLAKQQEKRDIERMLIVQKEHKEREERLAEEKKEARIRNNLENTKYLKKQVELRKQQKLKLEELNLQQAVIFKREAKKALKEEQTKESQRRLRAKRYQKLLLNQMQNVEEKKLFPVNLSDVERKLNTGLLNTVNGGENKTPRSLAPI